MSKRYKAVIVDFINDSLAPEKNVFGELASVEAIHAHREEELVGRVEDADAIMLYHDLSLTRKTIDRLENCKIIARCGVGCDNVDQIAAAQRGIPVANVPDYGTEEVADSAIGLMMAMARGINLLNSRLRDNQGPWSYQQVVPLRRLRGQVFGIIGLGRIGSSVALRAKALGMDVVFYDPYKPEGYDKAMGIRRVSELKDLLEQAFVLSLHCPLTEETKHMVDGHAISLMPVGSYLVNTARGEVIDASAIPAAIESGHLAGAGIDVLANEPPEEFNPLIAAWRNPDHMAYHRVLINPHSSFYSEEGLMDMRVKGAIVCKQALLDQPIPTIVNDLHLKKEKLNGSHCRSFAPT